MVQKIEQHELVCATTFLSAKIGLPNRTLPPHTSLKQSIVGYICAACGPESPTAGRSRCDTSPRGIPTCMPPTC